MAGFNPKPRLGQKKKKKPKNGKEHKSVRANKELDLDRRTKESILEEEMTLELLHRS